MLHLPHAADGDHVVSRIGTSVDLDCSGFPLPVSTIPMDMPTVPTDFDQVAIVVDWLDACRKRDIHALLELYSQDARSVCGCDAGEISEGLAGLEKYWRPRLDAFSPNAFGLEEIVPSADGVVLDYLNSQGKPVRIVFTFDPAGKLLQTHCEPFVPAPASNISGVRGQAC